MDNVIRKKLPKLTPLDRKLERLISLEEIEGLMKELCNSKVPIPDGFTGKFYHIFKEQSVTMP